MVIQIRLAKTEDVKNITLIYEQIVKSRYESTINLNQSRIHHYCDNNKIDSKCKVIVLEENQRFLGFICMISKKNFGHVGIFLKYKKYMGLLILRAISEYCKDILKYEGIKNTSISTYHVNFKNVKELCVAKEKRDLK